MLFSKFIGVDKTPVAGVDISQDYITFVKFKKEDSKSLQDYVIQIPTPEGSYGAGNILQPPVIGEEIRKIIDANEIGEVKINMAIPANIPFIRVLTLPDIPFDELKVIAQDEAANNLPFPISEANVDYVLLENTRRIEDNSKKLIDMLVVAVPKNIAQKYIDVADAARVKLNSIDITTYSLIKTLANSGQITEGKHLNVCIYIGYDYTDISIISNGMPLFSHITPIGKKNIIETMTSGLGLNDDQVEDFMPSVAILVPGIATPTDPQIVKAATLVRVIYNNICTEISKAIQFYKTQKSDSLEISKMFIGGCGMCIKNADIFIANRLKIDTEIVDPFKNSSVEPEKFIKYNVATLATGVGLALKGL